jgi:hypothetical protein
MMPVTSIAVMLPDGKRIFAQPDTHNGWVTIHDCKYDPLITITRQEASGIRDMLTILFPDV